MAIKTGAICHLELFAIGLDESARFYQELFGWATSLHDSGYLFWKDPSGMSGGFTTAGSPVTNPAATFYIKVDNIPETLGRIVEQGGVVIREKTEIGGDNGFYGIFRDPAGNNIGLWCAQ